MARNLSSDSSPTGSALWSIRNWSKYFSQRSSLRDELALLRRLFPLEWRIAALSEPVSKHQIRGDLVTIGGRGRLLALASELLRYVTPTVGRIPNQGRLRCWNLYEPTKSELLVSPLLRSVGEVKWQPQGARHGADYQLIHADGVHVAEVKRLCTPAKQDQEAMARVMADIRRSGPLFTPEEHAENTRQDARRLYPHVRHAARQLRESAQSVARRARTRKASVPGILFLDLDGNPYLLNLRDRICEWMNLQWATSIDLVVCFDYGSRDNVWGTIAEPIYSRSGAALETLDRALPICNRGHYHIGNLPEGKCAFPLPL